MADHFAAWEANLFSGRTPALYPVGKGQLAGVEVGPGRVLLIGGAPNAGKTALTMQFVFDALRLTPDLRAVVCNVEMAPAALFDRQLARLSRVNARDIQRREFGPEGRAEIEAGVKALKPLAARLRFVDPPYTLKHVAEAADDFGAKLVALDYIQRIKTDDTAGPGDKRSQVDEVMGMVRRFADEGAAVIVVAAVGRSKDQKGRNSYNADTLSLASFRESSELEYGADDAYILAPAGADGTATLKHVKSRYGETRDIALTFDKPHLTFKPFTPPGTS